MRHGAPTNSGGTALLEHPPPAPRHMGTSPAATVVPAWGDAAPRSLPFSVPAISRRLVASVMVGVCVVGLGTVVGTGHAPWAGRGSQITLVVDGQQVLVSSSASTVGALLVEQGVSTTSRDVIAPATSVPIDGPLEVSVQRARPVDLSVNGQRRTVWTTSNDVDELLQALGVREQAVFTSVSRSSRLPLQGAVLAIRTPRQVKIAVDGETRVVQTTDATVSAAIATAGIELDSDDRLSVPFGAPVVSGATYTVIRVEKALETNILVIRPSVRTQRRASLARGRRIVVKAPVAGVAEQVVTVVYENGVVISQRVMSNNVVQQPISGVIALGTGSSQSSATVAIPNSGGGPNFAALAKCESGGRPRAVNPSGKYRGLYQFDLGTWHGTGGLGDPIDASPEEQTKRARILYNDRGRAPWPYCGRFL